MRPATLALGLIAAVHGVAFACSCSGPNSVDEAFGQADQVAYGSVVELIAPDPSVRDVEVAAPRGCNRDRTVTERREYNDSIQPVTIVFEVIEGFANAEPGEIIELKTPQFDASCGQYVDVGETWVLFATDGNTSLCRGNQRIEDESTSQLLEELRAISSAEM